MKFEKFKVQPMTQAWNGSETIFTQYPVAIVGKGKLVKLVDNGYQSLTVGDEGLNVTNWPATNPPPQVSTNKLPEKFYLAEGETIYVVNQGSSDYTFQVIHYDEKPSVEAAQAPQQFTITLDGEISSI